MKRSYDSGENCSGNTNNKVLLVERNFEPNGVALVNPLKVGKHSFEETMELAETHSKSQTFIQSNAQNKLEIIGRQMKSLQDLMVNVLSESKLDMDLHNAACNFVKKPGQIYHLYKKESGQKYFSMLSPNEWGSNAPHQFLGSYKLEADQSWTKAGEGQNKFEGLNYLTNVFKIQQISALMDTQAIMDTS
ncbi:unnamed protein product [Brassicogethes aeneus]|uniref:DUF2452 domain-containing protein n=1 Tax=Brassicogethes aeneus TaxID=1431903 RepID=A0A9P0B6L9_BRAAE|nr:unnamed protein product [Brassicogethes aeneus]